MFAMAVSYVGPNDILPTGGFYSSLTGQYYNSQTEAGLAEDGVSQPEAPAAPKGQYDAATAGAVDPNSPSYLGPGYSLSYTPGGELQAVPSKDPTQMAAQAIFQQGKVGQAAPMNPAAGVDPMQTVNDVTARYKPTTALTPQQSLADAQALRGGTRTSLAVPGAVSNPYATTFHDAPKAPVITGGLGDAQKIFGGVGQPAPGTPGGAAPTVDTSKSDATIAGVNNTVSQLLALANQSNVPSVAEAMLNRQNAIDRSKAEQDLENSQAAALGAARSGNRRDQGILGREAIGESAYLGQEAQRQDVARQAAFEGNLGVTRAQEANDLLKTRAEIIGKAADLGLNVAALQVDVGKADLSSASNALNQAFASQNIDKQLSVDETKNTLSYLQAMSAIQFDYDKMSDADKQHTQDLMMQQYGIDAQTADVLAQIKANHKSTGEKILDGLLGLTESAAPVVAAAVTGGASAAVRPPGK